MTDLPEGPITDRTLDRLRTTAAMLAAVPDLRAHIRFGQEVLLEVGRPPHPATSHRIMPTCSFHRAVAAATRLRAAGDRVAMRGLPEASEPSIDWGIGSIGSVLPGGLLRLRRDERWWHLAPVIAGEETATAVASTLGSAADVVLHTDADVEVTIVHAATAIGDKAGSARAVDLIAGTMAALGVAALELRLGAVAG